MTLLCFGLGFSARAVARRWIADGKRVIGTSRDLEKRVEGVEMVRFDRGHPLDRAMLAEATHVLVSIPPDERGDPVADLHGGDLGHAAWLGYLSTTGVYGDRDGGWVDEDSDVRPTLDRSRRRAVAERQWLALGAEQGVPVHIFRLAGIYGPGRSAVDSVRNGKAHRIVKPGQVFSRIHVEDIAQAVAASVAKPHPGRIYNLCDDDPAPPQEVIAYACALLGVDPPPEVPFDQADLSPMARSFYADNKRVDNTRMKTELGVRLIYPTYREGLTAILAAEAKKEGRG